MYRKIQKGFAVGLTLALVAFAAGCSSPLNPVRETGSLSLSWAENVSRTLVPSLSMIPASYTLQGTGPNNAGFSQDFTATSATIPNLAFGAWTITITAKNSTGVPIGVASGQVTIHSNQTALLALVVRPFDGFGTLNLALGWNAADVDVPQIQASLLPAVGAARSLNFSVTGNSAVFSATDVSTGYHTLSLKLLDNGQPVMGTIEIVRIVKDQTTQGNYSFTKINKATGTLNVNVSANMADPLPVVLSGTAPAKPQNLSLTLNASVPGISTNLSFAWYVNGNAVGTGSSFTLDSSWPLGYYQVDVTAYTADGTRAGNAGTFVQVVAPAAYFGPRLLAIGDLSLTADLSGLGWMLENNADSASIFGGLGSGLAYAGGDRFLALPDRGPNATTWNVSVDNTTSYISRFHELNLVLTKNTGSGLPYLMSTALVQTQLLSTTDSLNYGPANDPALLNVKNLNANRGVNHFIGRSDAFAPGSSGNDKNGRLDPEGIRVSKDGQSVFISDEYGPYVYQLSRTTGQRIRTFTLPANFYVTNLSSFGTTEITGNTSGRVANKGMEGLAISPDGSTLFGFIQSALIQDGGDGAKVNRIVAIDVATGTVRQYAYNNFLTSTGKSYNSSELLAINSHELIVLERDGKGKGDGSAAVVKQIFKIDLAGATDISFLSGEANLLPFAVGKTLFIDLKDVLGKEGIPATEVPAKLEGMAFGKDLWIDGVLTHTLWISNDNDFLPNLAGPNRFYVFGVTDTDLASSTYVPQELNY